MCQEIFPAMCLAILRRLNPRAIHKRKLVSCEVFTAPLDVALRQAPPKMRNGRSN
jgi:hypothetical protein